MDAVLGWNLVLSLPVILAIAWLAGRLLGVSRSLPGTVLAGVAGWLAALALSLAIASGDTGAPGFTRNLWVFAAVFTMSASVWVELLAKPGALARAQRGLVSVPHPLRAVRRSSRRLSRYAQSSGIAVKHGFGPLLGLGAPAGDDPAAAPAAPAARRLRLALEECGGMFVKLGQVLSTRADLLPAGVVAELSRLQDQVAPGPPGSVRALLEAELSRLQDQVAPGPPGSVRALLEAELGRPVAEVFAELDPEPIAAGWGLIDFGPPAGSTPFSRRRCGRCWSRCSSATPGCCGRPCWRWPPCAATSTTTSWSGPWPASWPGTWPPGPPQRGHVQPPAAAVLGLRDQPPAGVLDLLPRPGHPGRDPDHPVARLPGHRGRRADRGQVGQGQPGPALPGGPGPPRAGQPGPAAPDPAPAGPHRHPRPARQPPGPVRLLADDGDVRTVTRLLNRVVLAGLGGLVGLLSVMLLGTQGGPSFSGDTSLFQFFGYFGLFCATVLILRVIVAILRDGLN